MNGGLKQVSSYQNEMWGINPANQIFQTTLQSSGVVNWVLMNGNFIWVSVGPTEVWALSPDYYVYTCARPCSGNWKNTYGLLAQVSVGPNEAWGVTKDAVIFKSAIPFVGWTSIAGALVNVSVGQNYIYGINNADTVFQCAQPCTGTWVQVAGSVAQLSASLLDDTFYGIGREHFLWKWTGSTWINMGTFDFKTIFSDKSSQTYIICVSLSIAPM